MNVTIGRILCQELRWNVRHLIRLLFDEIFGIS